MEFSQLTASQSVPEQFVAFLNSIGYLAKMPPDPMTGKYCRCHVEGDRQGTKNGWYRLIITHGHSRGYYGSHKTGGKGQMWRMDQNPLPPDRPLKIAPHVSNAPPCNLLEVFESGHKASATHPYLVNKGVQVHGDIRQLRGALLIPMRNVLGELTAVQRIFPNGTKKFVSGSRYSGSLFRLNSPSHQRIFIGEGYATCASILESLEMAGDSDSHVVMAGAANNLMATAIALKLATHSASIFIIADSDPIGEQKASEAAQACEGHMISISELEVTQ